MASESTRSKRGAVAAEPALLIAGAGLLIALSVMSVSLWSCWVGFAAGGCGTGSISAGWAGSSSVTFDGGMDSGWAGSSSAAPEDTAGSGASRMRAESTGCGGVGLSEALRCPNRLGQNFFSWPRCRPVRMLNSPPQISHFAFSSEFATTIVIPCFRPVPRKDGSVPALLRRMGTARGTEIHVR